MGSKVQKGAPQALRYDGCSKPISEINVSTITFMNQAQVGQQTVTPLGVGDSSWDMVHICPYGKWAMISQEGKPWSM